MSPRQEQQDESKRTLFDQMAKEVKQILEQKHFGYKAQSYSIISAAMAGKVEQEIISFLNSVDYTDTQLAIMVDIVKKWQDKDRPLPDPSRGLIGTFEIPMRFTFNDQSRFQMSGWAELYYKSLTLTFPKNKECHQLFACPEKTESATADELQNTAVKRKKRILFAFINMLANVADETQLQQLKMESADKTLAPIKELRVTRGFPQTLFSKEKDTHSYNTYVANIDGRLKQFAPVEEAKKEDAPEREYKM